MKKSIAFLLTALLLTACFAGCSTKPAGGQSPSKSDGNQAAEKKPLVVAVQSMYASYPMGLILAENMAGEYGLDLDIQVFSSGATINEAMGEWDIAVTGGAFVYALANYDCKLIAHQLDGTACNDFVCRPGSKWDNAKNDPTALKEAIKGSNVLCNVGTTGHYAFCLWLESLGMEPEDVNFMSMDFATVYSSWMAGEGDLCVMVAPYVNYDHGGVTLSSLADVGGHLYEATVCTSDAYKNRYDDVVAFVQMLYAACDKLAADNELALKTAYDWYVDNGKEMREDEVLAEVAAKPVFTSEYAKTLDLTDFACSYAEYFVSQGLIEEDRVSVVKENCANDILQDAMKTF